MTTAAAESTDILPMPPRVDPREFDHVFGALAAPFDRSEVKELAKGGKKMPYVTARTVMNRLDWVLGPHCWWDSYTAGEHSVSCRLTIRLPNGETITKEDAGAYAGMSDQGDDDKSGYSDALKRAAAKFGVGRYLYGDGVAIVPEEKPPARKPPEWKPLEWLGRQVDRANERWMKDLAAAGKDPEPCCNAFEMENHLGKAFVAAGLVAREAIETDGKRDRGKLIAAIQAADKAAIQAEAAAWIKRRLSEAAEAAGITPGPAR